MHCTDRLKSVSVAILCLEVKWLGGVGWCRRTSWQPERTSRWPRRLWPKWSSRE